MDFIHYKFEGVIGIAQLASLVYDIPNSLVCTLEDFMSNVGEIWKEYASTSHHHLEIIFTGSPGRPAFNIPKEILEMFIENKFTISMALMPKC